MKDVMILLGAAGLSALWVTLVAHLLGGPRPPRRRGG